MLNYKVKGRIFYRRALGVYWTYGLLVRDGRGRRLLEIPDISTEKKTVKALCDMLVALRPSTIHIEEIIEDFMTEGV